MKPLQFITMNTGHTIPSKRSDVADEVVALIASSLDRDGTLIDGWRITVEIDNGYAKFCAGADGIELALCVVCWQAARSPAVWQAMCDTAEVKALASPGAVHNPPHVPWLAATILPSAGDYTARFGALKAAERLFALGDLERCVAWTLIERANAKEADHGR